MRIYDEDAKVDLNAAPPELLAGVLGLVGLDDEQAATLAARIVDYRDEDDEAEQDGAEDPDYEAAGLRHGAIDRPLMTEAELFGVLGMTEAVYRRLRPLVTVHSGAEGIDPSRASRELLLAIPGVTPEIADAIRAVGPDGDPFEALDDDALFEIEAYFIPSREIVFRVLAEARTAGGGVFVREAVIELILEPDDRFWSTPGSVASCREQMARRWKRGYGRTWAGAADCGSLRRRSHRSANVGVEDDAGVAGREIAACDHLIEVTGRRSQEEQRRADHRGEPEIEAAPEREQSDRGEARLANPTSSWNGLSAQPMKRAAIAPKKVCMTKL